MIKDFIFKIYLKIPILRELAKSLQIHQETFVAQLLKEKKYQDPLHLARYEFQVYSQNGEDGIINEIFRRIGTTDRTFVEIGTGDGRENNTSFLLTQGWQGVWFEADPAATQRIKKNFTCFLNSKLNLVSEFIDAENIPKLMERAGTAREFDLLSIDIDLNTYWIWKALSSLKPRVVVIEYNSVLPSHVNWKTSYEPKGMWDGTSYMGASLKAYEILGNELGYQLVGCDLTGVNAFFVRTDLCADKFIKPSTSETHYEPARYWLKRQKGHRRGFREFSVH